MGMGWCKGRKPMSECVVCWKHTRTTIGPCGHPLCPECAGKWLQRKATCPICRSPSYGICAWKPAHVAHPCHVIRIPLPGGTHAGITLVNDEGAIRVKHVYAVDACARSGVRPNMLVEVLNGVPCKDAEEVTRMFDAARGSEAVVVVRCEHAKHRCLTRCLPTGFS